MGENDTVLLGIYIQWHGTSSENLGKVEFSAKGNALLDSVATAESQNAIFTIHKQTSAQRISFVVLDRDAPIPDYAKILLMLMLSLSDTLVFR